MKALVTSLVIALSGTLLVLSCQGCSDFALPEEQADIPSVTLPDESDGGTETVEEVDTVTIPCGTKWKAAGGQDTETPVGSVAYMEIGEKDASGNIIVRLNDAEGRILHYFWVTQGEDGPEADALTGEKLVLGDDGRAAAVFAITEVATFWFDRMEDEETAAE